MRNLIECSFILVDFSSAFFSAPFSVKRLSLGSLNSSADSIVMVPWKCACAFGAGNNACCEMLNEIWVKAVIYFLALTVPGC